MMSRYGILTLFFISTLICIGHYVSNNFIS
uniref:Uncharacterized protein n=1 Tax=Arundo donax TaxID=35708 RepID=A0A0A9D0U7_ARUDO